MCIQLNRKQYPLFDFIMYHSMIPRFVEDNNMKPIESYHIFFSGGAGVGKRFLLKVIIEYRKRPMKYLWSEPQSATSTCDSINRESNL